MKKPAYFDKDEMELAKSFEEGIPYQSLVSMLIHKYNEGKLSFNR